MDITFSSKRVACWHLIGWLVLILFEQFLVSYYTDYHVDLPVGIWHYTLSIILFYSNIWFLQHQYITSKKNELAMSVTTVLMQGAAYVLLNIWMFELLDYAGIRVRWSMSANWMIALAIWRAIFFMTMGAGYWALLWKIKSNAEISEPAEQLPEQQPENCPDHMYINPGVKGAVIKVNYDDIIYVEGLKNYIIIYTNETKYMPCLTLKEMENTLPPVRFTRIHKSFIINTDRIKSYEGNTVLLNQGSELPVGGSYKDSFLEHIAHRTVRREKAAV